MEIHCRKILVPEKIFFMWYHRLNILEVILTQDNCPKIKMTKRIHLVNNYYFEVSTLFRLKTLFKSFKIKIYLTLI